jgi:hypothetical protein
LGSIDFRAAARSVLLIGRVKKEPNVRVIIHDKSSLAPEGEPMAFALGDNEGFRWIGRYDITADELLSGKGGDTESKEDLAKSLILDLLADGKEMFSEDIEKAAAEIGISERTVRNAKRKLGDRLKSHRVGAQWVCSLSQPAIETANDIDSCRLPDGFCQMKMEPDFSDPKQRLAKAAEIMGLKFVDITDQCKPDGE